VFKIVGMAQLGIKPDAQLCCYCYTFFFSKKSKSPVTQFNFFTKGAYFYGSYVSSNFAVQYDFVHGIEINLISEIVSPNRHLIVVDMCVLLLLVCSTVTSRDNTLIINACSCFPST